MVDGSYIQTSSSRPSMVTVSAFSGRQRGFLRVNVF